MKPFVCLVFMQGVVLRSQLLATAAQLSYQPEVIRSENGVLDVTLDIDMVKSLQGIPYSNTGYRVAPGYNGAPIGPTMVVKPGDTVRVSLNNRLATSSALDRMLYDYVNDPTNDEINVTIISNRLSENGFVGAPQYGYWGLNYSNVHFHGVFFPPKVEALHEAIGGGESKSYVFQVPDEQEPGLFWYHNHAHGNAVYAYLSSLFGFFVVEGTDRDITKAPGIANATEVFMLLSEGLVNPDGSVPPVFPIVLAFNWTSVCNGHLASATVYNFTVGERALFRVASAGVEGTIRLSLANHTFVIVARDGMPLPSPEEVEVVSVPGGGRVEFLVEFTSPGSFVLTREPWGVAPPTAEFCNVTFGIPFYPCISFDVDRPVATINVMDTEEVNVTSETSLIDSIEMPEYSQRLKDLAKMKPVSNKTILFQQDTDGPPIFQIPFNPALGAGDGAPTGFGVNGRLYNPHHVEGTVKAGTCERWDVISVPPFSEHPFHAHGAQFLVLKKDGIAVEEPYWADTQMILQNITVHVCFDQLVPGDSVMAHCHMASHLDIGMATMYEVVASPDSSPTASPGESSSACRAYSLW